MYIYTYRHEIIIGDCSNYSLSQIKRNDDNLRITNG